MADGPTAESLPRRIGRYDIAGLLATGGMAEIFLGKIVGPNEFERPVVIKRLFPHLARSNEFVEGFLDEARIIAGIHHENVVHVHELCREGDDLYLVMEYLEGESVGGIMRRVWTRNEALGFVLSAHVIAEVCAGLHAAHELRYTDGSPQNVVHRDISPQNLMVTYAGAAKLLDFGIAKTARRVALTEAGVVKGKSAYMSPEQCRGKELDRRSDVFSLGTLLYELSTSRRLFHRPSDLATMTAITKHPVPRPSEILPGYPLSLERVCLKALAKSPDDRYPTAAAMRRDLVAAIRDLAIDEPLEEMAARLMQRMFADRIDEKAEMIRRVRAGTMPESVVAAEVDPAVELPLLDETTVLELPGVVEDPATETSWRSAGPAGRDVTGVVDREASPRARRLGAGVVIVASLLLGGGAAAIARMRTRHVAPESAVASVQPVSAVASAAPTAVAVHVESNPSGARVTAGDRDLGTTPLDASLPVGRAPVRLEIAQPGFAPSVQEVVPDANVKLVVTLNPLPIETADREVEPEPEPSATSRGAGKSAPRKRRAGGPAKSSDPFFRFE